ncbi:MAG: transcription-repair coupling factor [Brevinematales bacterium]|nr:transcription-repair coupling factor [Brevinematales bacterium]
MQFLELVFNAFDAKDLVLNRDELEISVPIGFLPFLFATIKNPARNVFFIARNEIEAEGVYTSLRSIGIEVLFFPEIDVLPFSNVFPSPDKLFDRFNTLYNISRGGGNIVITTTEAFLRKIPPLEFFKKSTIFLKKGEKFDRDFLIKKLSEYGYIREHKVIETGSFSVRGDIIDLFCPIYEKPLRIEFFGDEIEEIKFFELDTQKSFKIVDNILLTPADEFNIEKEFIKTEDKPYLSNTLIHSYFFKFYNSFSKITEYSIVENIVFVDEFFKESEEKVKKKYESKEETLLFSFEEILLTNCRIIKNMHLKKPEHPFGEIYKLPEFKSNFSQVINLIENEFLKNGYKIFILVEYRELADRLYNILSKFSPLVINPNSEIKEDKNVYIVIINYETGFEIKDKKLILISESDISGKKRLFRKKIRQIESFFEDVEDIKEGEYVVHINYGIGIFKGIERINVLGKEKDYILIEYKDKEKLYVPFEQSNLIGKYLGDPNKKPELDSLGAKSWQKKRERVKKSIEEFADKLVSIYAKRRALQGYAFNPDTVWQKEFEDKFEYIETPDQIKVIEEIKRDMESPRPMERLLCGDVGFGKTEVAMRVAFKAVMDGKQVAVVAPTTVLVEQHFITFSERFKGFPVRIEYLSRFTENSKEKEILNQLKNHKIDIIIGTHKLFSEKIVFQNLGLIIIDEEHKFGVLHKEALKERYPLVDFLSLSATPIPRTLNMALSSLRDISLLQTPPDMRIPVETYVGDFSLDILKYAVESELKRGGQVFFVHNTIKRLPEYAYLIESLVPEAKTTIGHGRMDEEELESSFLGFVRGDYNVFVCTAIIDSGLDIPNANTIIVSDSHKFGLSQLYQLKGRVGRGKNQGYAYFLYPKDKILTENAEKRLYVIQEYTDLGAGFNIALRDLEIRGAGNILGKEQHGNIVAIGYDMYMKLLRKEVEKLKGEEKPEIITLIDLKYNAFIPDFYISDNSTKMEVYKKILSVNDEIEIDEIKNELKDRFGEIPEEVLSLFEISRLKILAGKAGIESIIEKGDLIEIEFSKYSKANVAKIMKIVSETKDLLIKPNEKNKIFMKTFESNIYIKVRRLTSFIKDIVDI